jgi:hypothetical protein
LGIRKQDRSAQARKNVRLLRVEGPKFRHHQFQSLWLRLRFSWLIFARATLKLSLAQLRSGFYSALVQRFCLVQGRLFVPKTWHVSGL